MADIVILILFVLLIAISVYQEYRIEKQHQKRLVGFLPYIIQEGDTLYSIASEHDTTESELAAWNEHKVEQGWKIKPGDSIFVPIWRKENE